MTCDLRDLTDEKERLGKDLGGRGGTEVKPSGMASGDSPGSKESCASDGVSLCPPQPPGPGHTGDIFS